MDKNPSSWIDQLLNLTTDYLAALHDLNERMTTATGSGIDYEAVFTNRKIAQLLKCVDDGLSQDTEILADLQGVFKDGEELFGPEATAPRPPDGPPSQKFEG